MPNDVIMRCTSLVRLQNSITKSLKGILNIPACTEFPARLRCLSISFLLALNLQSVHKRDHAQL